LGVAGVEETWRAEETGDAEVLEGAMGEVEAVVARGTGEAIEVRDAVEAGDVGGAVGDVKVVGIAAAGARNSIMARDSAAEILAGIQQ
jgi:hypothetical protein